MKTEIIKEYIDIDYMIESVLSILKDTRDDFKDDENTEYLDTNFSDDYLEEMALEQALEWNDDMNKYLHMKDHRIYANFNNVDYDYPYFRTGEFGYDDDLVNDMIKRLDDNCQDEQTQADRRWLVDWFWETFGTYGFTYNFQSTMSDSLYEWEHEKQTA